MPYLSPPTLTEGEQKAILAVTATNLRDHAIVSLALGTGLRLGELLGLDVGDVFGPEAAPRQRIRVRAEIAKGGRVGDVFLPAALEPKLRRLWTFKAARGERLAPDAPLFCAQAGGRLSKRRVQVAWHGWQRKAGFDRAYPFHSLRHSAVTNVYRASRDLFLAQRFARHASPLTTTIYTHPGDDELIACIRKLAC